MFARPGLAPPDRGRRLRIAPRRFAREHKYPLSPRPSSFFPLPFTLHPTNLTHPTVQLPGPSSLSRAGSLHPRPTACPPCPLTRRPPIPSALTPLCLSRTMEKLSPLDRQPTVSDRCTYHAPSRARPALWKPPHSLPPRRLLPSSSPGFFLYPVRHFSGPPRWHPCCLDSVATPAAG